MSEIIIGRNAVLEALKNNREIEKITVARGAEGSVKQITGKAKAKKIPLYYSDRARMDRDAQGGSHQGVIAVVSDYRYATVDEILAKAEGLGEKPFVMILDGLEDPHNLGAIMRTAECAGVHGIIIPKKVGVGERNRCQDFCGSIGVYAVRQSDEYRQRDRQTQGTGALDRRLRYGWRDLLRTGSDRQHRHGDRQ